MNDLAGGAAERGRHGAQRTSRTHPTGPSDKSRTPASPLKLSVDPSSRNPLIGSSRENRALASYIADYNADVAGARWAEASNRAGAIAVRLENFDHPDALTWWERQRECERRRRS